MTTPDDRRAIIVEQTGIAMKAARDRELATRRAEVAETEVMMLRASLQAVIDDVLHGDQITDRVWQQAITALEWSAQEGDAG
jgi:chromosome condensin MukBEF ATPase and DNA-binding subunit MukB